MASPFGGAAIHWMAASIRLTHGRQVSVDNLEKLADAFELPVPELLTPPRPANLADHFKGLGIEEPRAYYGPVAAGVMH